MKNQNKVNRWLLHRLYLRMLKYLSLYCIPNICFTKFDQIYFENKRVSIIETLWPSQHFNVGTQLLNKNTTKPSWWNYVKSFVFELHRPLRSPYCLYERDFVNTLPLSSAFCHFVLWLCPASWPAATPPPGGHPGRQARLPLKWVDFMSSSSSKAISLCSTRVVGERKGRQVRKWKCDPRGQKLKMGAEDGKERGRRGRD